MLEHGREGGTSIDSAAAYGISSPSITQERAVSRMPAVSVETHSLQSSARSGDAVDDILSDLSRGVLSAVV